MKECKFCHFIDGVDFYPDHELIEKSLTVNITAEIERKNKDFAITCKAQAKKELYLAVYIDQDNNLCTYLDPEINTDKEGIRVETLKKQIRYCPICGRDLLTCRQ